MLLTRNKMYFPILIPWYWPQSWWPFLRMLLPLLPSRTNQVKDKSFVYNDSSFGLSFKSYITLVSVALALDFNGLRQSCTSYQWQSGIFDSFIMTACDCWHQLCSCCSASCSKFIFHPPSPSCPHCSSFSELCCSLTLNFSPWTNWCRPIALFLPWVLPTATFLCKHRIFKRVKTW